MTEILEFSIIFGDRFSIPATFDIHPAEDGLIGITSNLEYIGRFKIELRPDDARTLGQALLKVTG